MPSSIPGYPADNFRTELVAHGNPRLSASAEHRGERHGAHRQLRTVRNRRWNTPAACAFSKTGWTPELRTQQLEWFLKAANYKGGSSFDKFIEFIRNDSLSTFTEAEKTQLAALIEKKPERKSAIENVGAMFVGRTPTMWTLDELSAAAKNGMKGRSFDNGRRCSAPPPATPATALATPAA